MNSVIAFNNVVKKYNGISVVDNLSFEIYEGEIFGFLGPNGAGKSTSIKMMIGLLNPSSGEILIDGIDISKADKNKIGICPQNIVLWDYLTCLENLELIGKMYEIPKDLLKERALNILKLLQLENKKDVVISKLSGGMKRRMNIAMATIHNPDILVLDEPSEGLDPQSRRLLWDYISFLKKEGKTIILTTHLMDEADALSDRIAIIDEGKLLKLDTPKNLKESIGKGDTVEIELSNKDMIEETLELIVDNVECSSYFINDNKINLVTLDATNKLSQIIPLIEKRAEINQLAIRQNTLEDVFIELTGKQLRGE